MDSVWVKNKRCARSWAFPPPSWPLFCLLSLVSLFDKTSYLPNHLFQNKKKLTLPHQRFFLDQIRFLVKSVSNLKRTNLLDFLLMNSNYFMTLLTYYRYVKVDAHCYVGTQSPGHWLFSHSYCTAKSHVTVFEGRVWWSRLCWKWKKYIVK